MNKELTAMQMLIEAMQKSYDSIDGSESFTSNIQKGEIGNRIRQAKSLLQKEQEQIEKAFSEGFDDGIESELGYRTKYENQRDYYKSKYGGEV
ncbi:hypothetical protein G5B30_16595 [Sphingobacterium sp. SGG-5]|uniref:hypothetical protein n=1 Tax=Sphingobacterium sp. SGG-5 TaxID=2710881 RepID=UPI0013ED62B7|nr:hypothetical protein [Sphingobacterium sp. SGG-5]NGM63530.1 hypothetical protein [Sphingobacterium sp. SGG-5]